MKVHNKLCAEPILENGTESQQRGYSRKHDVFNSVSSPRAGKQCRMEEEISHLR